MSNNKLFDIILYALLGLSTVLGIYFYIATDFKDVTVNAPFTSGVLITWCYILLAIAALTAIVFPMVTMAQNPKNAKNALIGVAGLVVVFGVGYVMSSGVDTYDPEHKLLATAGEAKMSEAGLIAFYILGAVAIGSIIFSEVSKSFK